MALTKLTSNLIEGGTGTDWVTAIQTSNFTAAAGKGYFVNTTSQVLYVTLPVGVVGMEITIQDYAGTFATNKVILNANGSEKIQGSAIEGQITTNNATAVLIYQDATKGWTSQDITLIPQVVTFDYMLIGGGASGGQGSNYGGGGSGGLAAGTSQTLSTSINITIGGGGASGTATGVNGIGSTISGNISATASGGAIGSASTYGGNAGSPGYAGGSGGVVGGNAWYLDGGGGGLGAVGQNYTANSSTPHLGANGGIGTNSYSTWATATGTGDGGYYGGGGGAYGWHRAGPNTYTDWDVNTGVGGTGGGGNAFPASVTHTSAMNGAANTGGGGGNTGGPSVGSSQGGSGICIIRYSGSQAASGGTIVTTGGYTYHTFTASGTLTKT